jgi:hypothetical protein
MYATFPSITGSTFSQGHSTSSSLSSLLSFELNSPPSLLPLLPFTCPWSQVHKGLSRRPGHERVGTLDSFAGPPPACPARPPPPPPGPGGGRACRSTPRKWPPGASSGTAGGWEGGRGEGWGPSGTRRGGRQGVGPASSRLPPACPLYRRESWKDRHGQLGEADGPRGAGRRKGQTGMIERAWREEERRQRGHQQRGGRPA